METTSSVHLMRSMATRTITAVKVTDSAERLQCLPQIAGKNCVVLEHTIYDMLSMLSDDYDGGYWDYYRLSNGGFYMAPNGLLLYGIRSHGNFFEGEVFAETAGIIATAMAYSHLSFLPTGGCFGMAYQLISEFINEHPEARIIRAALD